MTNLPNDGGATAAKPRPELGSTGPAPTNRPPLDPVPETAPVETAQSTRARRAAALAAEHETDRDLMQRRRAVIAIRRARRDAADAALTSDDADSGAAPVTPAVADAPQPRPTPVIATQPQVVPAQFRLRHWLIALSFVLIVIAPLAAVTGYLYTRAADQYHSEVAFSIRSEEAGSAAAGLLGAITSIGTGSASDADILFEYVRSQGIVQAIDADLDLRAIYSRAENDPFFTLRPDATVEDLLAQWRRMVDVSFESGTGIIHARANAFAPEDATAISRAILAKSSALVNQLSEQAREDAVRFAREEFAEAEGNLRAMRQRLSEFRRENRIVDPSGDVAGQSGLLNALQSELAQALVERDMLLSFVGEEDQRVIQANRRITAVEGRIEAERASLGVSGTEGALPDVVGRYEELLVDLEFANAAYTQTLAGLASARAEARRQSRYLAPHVQPTMAERSLYPRRGLLVAIAGFFLLLGWCAAMLIYYNVRDNR
jgi:capsular polysaccharide transport system permease protein